MVVENTNQLEATTCGSGFLDDTCTATDDAGATWTQQDAGNWSDQPCSHGQAWHTAQDKPTALCHGWSQLWGTQSSQHPWGKSWQL